MPLPTAAQSDAFYKAATLGLAALERREGRSLRAGPDADARWARFSGALHTGDRLDMLLRDAAVTWGSAFAGAQVFQLPGVAADDPFGPQWLAPNRRRGEASLTTIGSASPTLDDIGRALGIPAHAVALPAIGPATRLTIAGGAAILAAARHFLAHDELDWSRQVTIVAQLPRNRQLAGLVAIFLRGLRPAPLRSEPDPSASDTILTSPDAAPDLCAQLGA